MRRFFYVVLAILGIVLIATLTSREDWWNSLPEEEQEARIELANRLENAMVGDLVHFKKVDERGDTLVTTGRISWSDHFVLEVAYPGPMSDEIRFVMINRSQPTNGTDLDILVTGMTSWLLEPERYHIEAGWYFLH